MQAVKNWCDRERVKKLGTLRQTKQGDTQKSRSAARRRRCSGPLRSPGMSCCPFARRVRAGPRQLQRHRRGQRRKWRSQSGGQAHGSQRGVDVALPAVGHVESALIAGGPRAGAKRVRACDEPAHGSLRLVTIEGWALHLINTKLYTCHCK
jgi:hypothetical protein